MSIEDQGQKDDVSSEITELESRFFGRSHRAAATEQLLWAYALGTLSLEEEDTVHALIAGDDKAQDTLARIHRSLETGERKTAAVSPAVVALPEPTLAARIWGATTEALGSAWDALSLKPEEVIAVFLLKPEGLAVRVLQGIEVPLEPSYLSRELPSTKGGSGPAPEALTRRKVRLVDGTEVSVVSEPEGSFRLIISLPDRAIEGLVRVQRSVVRDRKRVEDETAVQGRVRNGVATLKECPEGPLRIISPDGRTFVVILGRG